MNLIRCHTPGGGIYGTGKAMRKLCDRHIEAYQAFQRAPEGEASRRAENAHHEALDAILRYECTCEDDAQELYNHLHWYRFKEGDQMDPQARVLLAVMQHTPGPGFLVSHPANDYDWRRT